MSKKKTPKYDHPHYYELMVGHKVVKKSGKPFKSGDRTATVDLITTNPNSGKIAFKLKEDDSIVDCMQCTPVDPIVTTLQRKYNVDTPNLSAIADSSKATDIADTIMSININLNPPWWKRVLIWLRLMKNPIHTFTFNVLKSRSTRYGVMNMDCEDIDNMCLSPKNKKLQKTHSYDTLTGETTKMSKSQIKAMR